MTIDDSDTTPTPEGDVAAPLRFADLDLPEPVLGALVEDGYTEPSPIQAAIIPHLLAGRDVIGQAQTGTGKTAAFALPILARLATDQIEGAGRAKGPTSLILAPTRELAIQVADAFERYGRRLSHVRVLAVYGGADMRSQSIALHRGVDVVVGTPGRVMDHMRRGSLDVGHVRTLVLDEADEMLRMGFVDDVEWVLSETPPGRQVALFSATMPTAIQRIAEKQLRDPERVRIAGGGKTADTVRQRYWRAEGMGKVEALCRLLTVEPVDAAIVFVRTRSATAELARALEDAGFPAAPLSGDVPQAQRERTLDALREGRLKLVVATDVAARGIDVPSITHVFNFDVPVDTEAYIHRIGRTGRAGRAGEAVLFVENRQRQLLLNIERATGRPIEKMQMPTPEEMHALQLQRFAERFKARLTRKGDASEPAALRGFIEQICDETGRDPLDVAAFLVGPAMRTVLDGSGRAGIPGDQEPSAPSTPRKAVDKPAGRAPIGGRTRTYRVAVGERDGVRAGHLVGAIANESGLDGQDIGGIRIYEGHSTVELLADLPADVLQLLDRCEVLGKPLRLTPADAVSERVGTSSRAQGDTRPSAVKLPRPVKPAYVAASKAKPTARDVSRATDPPPRQRSTTSKDAAHPKLKPKAPPFKAKKAAVSKPAAKRKVTAQAGGKVRNVKASAPPSKPSTSKPARATGNKPPRSGGHSLAPAPFAGGVKPKRVNKKKRPKA